AARHGRLLHGHEHAASPAGGAQGPDALSRLRAGGRVALAHGCVLMSPARAGRGGVGAIWTSHAALLCFAALAVGLAAAIPACSPSGDCRDLGACGKYDGRPVGPSTGTGGAAG